IGVLQASLITSHGNADVWFVYLVLKQVVTVVYVLLFNRLGIDALMLSLVAINYAMWVPTVFIVARILDTPVLRYLGSLAVPTLAVGLMLLTVGLVRLLGAEWGSELRLAVSIIGGAGVYCGVVFLLARDRLWRMRDVILKRRRAA